ncbi:hypothetical protein CBW65_22890 [Tumebacillus avium]|uniref:DUF3231 domain-containing protein n=1 Tax=Tumebacillus avium TaxID=1903704 RepID=A0A1Y0IW18_9BACL|nr:DUF3231 family protein [Tumebacillus avium]ARU63534.1 hypothetical protein CBW65_22890 [Tumebacillus avium]
MNILETLAGMLKHTVGEDPPAPLHVGEVMYLWTYLAMVDEVVSYLDSAMHMTTDQDLIQNMQDCKSNCHDQHNRLTAFMLKEGVPLPPTSEEKPKSNPNAVPLGVKLTDDEIANGLAAKTAASIMTCAAGITTSVRIDVGIMWTTCQVEKMEYGSKLRMMMQKRGWLKVPPYYYPPGMPERR